MLPVPMACAVKRKPRAAWPIYHAVQPRPRTALTTVWISPTVTVPPPVKACIGGAVPKASLMMSCTSATLGAASPVGSQVMAVIAALTWKVAVPDFVLSKTLVAVMVACVADVTVGAVHVTGEPALALSEPADAVQVNAVLVVLSTCAVNCWLPPDAIVPEPGVTFTATGGDSVSVYVPAVVLSTWLVAVTTT